MASSPVLGESAQALFCAVADLAGLSKMKKNLTLEKYPTYTLFKKDKKNKQYISDAWKATNLVGVSLSQIEKFLTSDKEWYESSVLIATAMLEKINSVSAKFAKVKTPGIDIFYSRGATGGQSVMNDIDNLWTLANKNDKKFGDINKWSPADIYFVSTKARKVIKTEITEANTNKSYTWTELNSVCNKLIKSGDLLPLSLKKVISGKPLIVLYNFSRSKDEKDLADCKYIKCKKSGTGRDMQIIFKNAGSQLKFRHDPHHTKFGANKALKGEIIVQGMGGRLGSIGSISILLSVIEDAGTKSAKQFHTDLTKAWNTGWKKYTKGIDNLNNDYGVAATDSHSKLKRKTYDQYKADRASLSQKTLMSSILPVIEKYFEKHKKSKKAFSDSDIMVQAFIKYASSRSPKSGKFVIAK